MPYTNQELEAARAIKTCQLSLREAETDSCGDPLKALRLKLHKFVLTADTILGDASCQIIRDWPPD